MTNTLGSLVRSREVRKAGAGAGGAAILLAIGVATAAAVALPWALPIGAGAPRGEGEGEGHGSGQGKGYRGGRADAAEAPAPATQGSMEPTGGCADEKCDGTCPTDPAALAERHGKGQAQDHAGGGGHDGIKGSMTLGDAAAEAGVPVGRLAAELKLPAGTPPTETLGRLRRQHGFTMEEVRAAIARLKQPKATNP